MCVSIVFWLQSTSIRHIVGHTCCKTFNGTDFSDAFMNIFIHEDASLGALKTCSSAYLGMGNRSYFSKTKRGSDVMLAQTATI